MTGFGLPEHVAAEELWDDEALLPGGLRLALRVGGPAVGSGLRPFLLVHGLASNARLWDGVARRLAAAGHPVIAVDQRGHGRSAEPDGGYDTQTCAADLTDLCAVLGMTGGDAPVVAGQSWGGNVVLALAAKHGPTDGGPAAVALVDGGWIRLRERFSTFDECWLVLAPPRFDGMRWADLSTRIAAMASDWPPEGVAGSLANLLELPDGTVRARLARDHHRDIVRSLWELDPRPMYARVRVPALLMAAVVSTDDPRSAPVTDAAAALPDAQVRWYVGAHHDLHAQHPERTTKDLLELALRAQGAT